MKISYNWLQTYFDTKLPSYKEIEEKLTFHSFEIEDSEVVGDDVVIDVDVLPNRAHDCLSHRGIAKEISVLFDIPLKEDVFRKKEGSLIKSKLLSVDIENSLLCRRYIGAVIQGIKVGPSPKWLVDFLTVIGQKSINNVVDATNYVMFGLGQPLHAFDADKLEKKDGKYKIIIREAKDDKKIKTLNDEEFKLSEANLLIVDGNSNCPIGIAGIKGGKTAEIDEKTSNIIIESANFNPSSTRKTSQNLKLRTDASVRFENELSPDIAYYGLIESVKLIKEIAGGEVDGYVDEYPRRKNITYKSGVSISEINRLLGTKITNTEVESILSRFGFQYEKVEPIQRVIETAKGLKDIPYKYGASILFDAPKAFDCSSFVSFCFSRAGISIPRVTIDQYVYGAQVSADDISDGDIIFSTQKDKDAKESYKRLIDNKDVVDFSVKRKTFDYMPGTEVLEGVSHCGIYLGDGYVIHASGKNSSGKVVIEKVDESKNFENIVGYRRMTDNKERLVVDVPFERLDLRIKEDLIEEIGRVYGYSKIMEDSPNIVKGVNVNKKYYYSEKIRDFLTKEGFTEVYTYSLRNNGELELENPLASDKNFIRNTLNDGINESLSLNKKNVSVLGLSDIKIFEIGNVFNKDKESTMVCLGMSKKDKSEELVVNKLFDLLEIEIVGEWDNKTYEFNLDEIIDLLKDPNMYDVKLEQKNFSYKPFSLFPSVLRDIAVWVPENVSSEEVLSILTKESGELLVQLSIFDEYKKDGRISYAFKMVFQSRDKTLSDEEIGSIMRKITDILNKKDGFEVR